MTTTTEIHPEAVPSRNRTSDNRKRQVCWVVLPAYNEEQSLPPLLDRIAESMVEAGTYYQILVVDDGSNDATARIAEERARSLPLALERHAKNMGLGATIRDGMLKAIELADAEDVIVTMDADNSHNPELIPPMIRLIRQGNDVVIASRYQPGSHIRGVSRFRRMLSFGGGLLLRIVFPIRGVRDYTCGYRAYRAGSLKDAQQHYEQNMFDQEGFQCMVDILLKLRRMDLIFTEVPMVLRYDLKESTSKMKVGRTIKNTLLLMLKRRLGA